MDKIEKIIDTINNSRQPVRFRELRLLLNHYGYELERQRGSHVHFYKQQSLPIQFPVHNNHVKRFYAQIVLKKLGL